MFRKPSHISHQQSHTYKPSHDARSHQNTRMVSNLFTQQRNYSHKRMVEFMQNGPHIPAELSKEEAKRRELLAELAARTRLEESARTKKLEIIKLRGDIRKITEKLTKTNNDIEHILKELGEDDDECMRPGSNR